MLSYSSLRTRDWLYVQDWICESRWRVALLVFALLIFAILFAASVGLSLEFLVAYFS